MLVWINGPFGGGTSVTATGGGWIRQTTVGLRQVRIDLAP